MERMVNKRLMWVLESKGLLASEQCGFRKHRSTADQLVRFDNFIRNAFAKKRTRSCPFLWPGHHVETRYSVRSLRSWFSRPFAYPYFPYLPTLWFLSHRLFQVRAGSTLSDTYEQEMGVPQGSILSPILFSLKINSIVKSVSKSLKASLFVDDCATCIREKFLPHAQRLMQPCVNSVLDWVSKNCFK